MATARDRDRSESAAPAVFAAAVPRVFAHAEGSARFDQSATRPGIPDASFDRRLVRQLLAHLSADSDLAMEYFYARLFADHPELRGLFPYTMTQTRFAVFGMLARLVENLDDEDATRATLDQLARDHRKFGVKDKHYRPFFDALFAMADHLGGAVWTAEMAVAWRSALDYFAAVMNAVAIADAQSQPAWWTGEVVQHDRRTETVAVLTIRPDRPLRYAAGQYIEVQAPRWPRIWRRYSIANAPRENGLIDIHVRAVPAGLVSNALVSHCATGDAVLLSSARGDLAVPADPGRDLVCVGGGTGLAPVKAITEEVVGAARQGRRRAITLYVGARRSRDLYDMRDLETLRLAYPSLTVIPVAEHELDFAGRVGRLPDVVWAHPSFRDCEVYVAGPAGLVSATVKALSRRVPADRLHHDPLDALELARRPPRPDALGQPAAAS